MTHNREPLDPETLQLYTDAHRIASNIGALLRNERRRRRVPVHVVATESGVSKAVIWRVEHGNDAKVSTLVMLLAWMLREDDNDETRTDQESC
jgi:transcriptional regulator with XRE-family HTH domain